MSRLTLADAIRLSPFRNAEPAVIAAAEHMDRAIRWAHATEQVNVAPILRPGDLVLTMGTSLPADDDSAGFDEFARALADAESTGVVVELGRRWTTLPPALVEACQRHEIPLIALAHETRFAALTQAIGEQIVDGQLAELREAQRVHDTFTELSFDQAGPAEILNAVSRLANGPVVLENAQHQPLDFLPGPTSHDGFLENWQGRSARVRVTGRTGWDARNGWLVTRLGTGNQDWGRLIISSPDTPPQRLMAVAERAAAALALHRLHERDRDNVIRRTHRELLIALETSPEAEETLARCEVVKFPTQRRQFVALTLRPRRLGRADEVLSATVHAAHGLRTPALVADLEGDIVVLLSAAPTTNLDALVDRLAARLKPNHDLLVAAGRVVDSRELIAQTLMEAHQVANAVAARNSETGPEVHRLEDLHLRGLLALFGDDDRLTLFVDRELAPLKKADAASRGDLVGVLRALFEHPSSKSDAAASLHLSRAAFYDRLAKIEQVLGVDLDDPDVRVSLHVALMADAALNYTGSNYKLSADPA
ncbi:MAG TPA: PucR family transcriptional regulator ligand-binding domain-containing protein [Marmoricola sp.]|nr:PucR family transcriptional regulator ligand-binding domain-containing protein [Marmoricola sp.]